MEIITVPFGWILSQLYQFTTNYGVALILFTLIVKLVLLPITAKSKRSTMKMSRLSPKVQAIQKKYENDQQKQNEALQALYKQEGVSMGGGCLWSFVPLLILLPLYSVVREPITYMLQQNADVAAEIVTKIRELAAESFPKDPGYYDQMIAAALIPQFASAVEAIEGVTSAALSGVNFDFLGIDLSTVPNFEMLTAKWPQISQYLEQLIVNTPEAIALAQNSGHTIFMGININALQEIAKLVFDWSVIGVFLIPILSAGSQVLSMFLSNKANNSLVTNEKGVQDKETAQKSQTAKTGKIMMWTMPLMSLWIGFGVPCALSLYWLVQGLLGTAIDVYLTKKYRKIYDAEDAALLEKAMAEEAAEEEKERQRAQRRAENPDGITANTSKKKLQQQKQKENEAAKKEAAKEYAVSKGIYVEEEKTGPAPLSGIADRPNCKGRNYDPNRYAAKNTEE